MDVASIAAIEAQRIGQGIMADRWIITTHTYCEHKSLAAAKAERKRLAKQCPNRQFKLRRTKTSLNPSRSKRIIADLERQVADLKSQIAALQPDV